MGKHGYTITDEDIDFIERLLERKLEPDIKEHLLTYYGEKGVLDCYRGMAIGCTVKKNEPCNGCIMCEYLKSEPLLTQIALTVFAYDKGLIKAGVQSYRAVKSSYMRYVYDHAPDDVFLW